MGTGRGVGCRKFLGNVREISWKSSGGPKIRSGIVKREIDIFTIGLQGNYPTTMVHPPIEYSLHLKICNFPQMTPFPQTLHIQYYVMTRYFVSDTIPPPIFRYVIQSHNTVCNTNTSPSPSDTVCSAPPPKS